MLDAAFWAGLGCVGGIVLVLAGCVVLVMWSKAELIAMVKSWLNTR